jgi:hypothetical protein
MMPQHRPVRRSAPTDPADPSRPFSTRGPTTGGNDAHTLNHHTSPPSQDGTGRSNNGGRSRRRRSSPCSQRPNCRRPAIYGQSRRKRRRRPTRQPPIHRPEPTLGRGRRGQPHSRWYHPAAYSTRPSVTRPGGIISTVPRLERIRSDGICTAGHDQVGRSLADAAASAMVGRGGRRAG